MAGLLVGLVAFRDALFRGGPLPRPFASFAIALGIHLEPSVVYTYELDRGHLLRSWLDSKVPELRRRLSKAAPTAPLARAACHGGVLRLGFDQAGGAAAVNERLLEGTGGLLVRRQDSLTVDLGVDLPVQERLMAEALQTLRHTLLRRVDAVGVTASVMAGERPDAVTIRVWGVPAEMAERLNGTLTSQGDLSLAAVDDATLEPWFAGLRAQLPVDASGRPLVRLDRRGRQAILRGDRRETLRGLLQAHVPAPHRLAFQRIPGKPELPWKVHLVLREGAVSGARLSDVQVEFDPVGSHPVISLRFDEMGTAAFAALTERHVGDRLAVVLDGEAHSAPVVQEPIRGGRATLALGAAKTMQAQLREAQDLAAVLRAGALPAPLKLTRTQAEPASLGAPSVWVGRVSLLLACALFALAAAVAVAGALRLVARVVDIRRARARRSAGSP